MIPILLLSVTGNVNAASAPDFKEGLWEIEEVTDIPFAPAPFTHTTRNYTECKTKNDIIPSQKPKTSNCVVKDFQPSGNTGTWDIVCTKMVNGGQQYYQEQKGEVIFQKEEMKAIVQITDTINRGTMTITQTGHYIGPCVKNNKKSD